MTKQSFAVDSKNHVQFFDHVRNITMLCVVLYHTVKAYSTTTPDHPIHDINPLLFSDYVRWIFDVFMMPVFFFAAGFFVVQSLKVKSLGSYILSKVKRLGIPWFALMISLVALTNFGDKFKSAFKNQEIISFGDVLFDMLKRFTLVYQSDRGESHLWFLSLLLFFFIIFGLFYKIIQSRFKIFSHSQSNVTSGKSTFQTLLIFGIAMSILYFIVLIFFPKINDWVYFSYLTFEPTKTVTYLGCFILGIYAYSNNWFTDNVKIGYTGFWIVIVIISLSGFLISGKEILIERTVPDNFSLLQLILFAISRTFFCLSVLVLLVLLTSRFWSNSSKFIKKLSDNSYHIYIIHMYIVIALQAVLINWQGPTPIKLIIVFLSALIISYLMSEYITNRFPKIFVSVLILISVSLVFIMNPYRYEKQFNQKQQNIKDRLTHMKIDNMKLRNEAIYSFEQTLKNPPQGLLEAFEKLSLTYQNKEDDYEIMSYLGRASVMLVINRVVNNPLEYMVYYAKGFKWLDKAVKYDPDNLNVRLNRAMTSMIVKPFLDREKIAKIDLEYLADKIQNNPNIDKSIKVQVFSSLEKIYEKERANTKAK